MLDFYRVMLRRHRDRLALSYAMASVALLLTTVAAPKSSYLAFMSVAWFGAPALIATAGRSPNNIPVLIIAGVLLNGGVYALLSLAVHRWRLRRELSRRRQRRQA
jgi:hypothetical protein